MVGTWLLALAEGAVALINLGVTTTMVVVVMLMAVVMTSGRPTRGPLGQWKVAGAANLLTAKVAKKGGRCGEERFPFQAALE